MKTQSDNGQHTDSLTLFQLVKLLAGNARPSALRNNSFIVNDIAAEFSIRTDENMLATVLSRLVYTLVNNATDSCIRISAKEYDDIIFVHLKSTGGDFNNDSIDSDLQQAQSYAKKMNGNIGLSKDEDKINGIIFSFPNIDFAKKNGSAGLGSKAEVAPNVY